MGLEHCSTSLEAVASQQTLLQGVEETFNFLSQSTTLTMGSNKVRQYGGAVYVTDSYPIFYCFPDRTNLEKCFFQVDGSYRISSDICNSFFSDPAVSSFEVLH